MAGVAIYGEAKPASRGWKFGEGWLIPGEDNYGSLDVWSPREDDSLFIDIIEEHGVSIIKVNSPQGDWGAAVDTRLASRNYDGELCTVVFGDRILCGNTPKIAALRALAEARLGKAFSVPAELFSSQ